jgi:hypothetical protein
MNPSHAEPQVIGDWLALSDRRSGLVRAHLWERGARLRCCKPLGLIKKSAAERNGELVNKINASTATIARIITAAPPTLASDARTRRASETRARRVAAG